VWLHIKVSILSFFALLFFSCLLVSELGVFIIKTTYGFLGLSLSKNILARICVRAVTDLPKKS